MRAMPKPADDIEVRARALVANAHLPEKPKRLQMAERNLKAARLKSDAARKDLAALVQATPAGQRAHSAEIAAASQALEEAEVAVGAAWAPTFRRAAQPQAQAALEIAADLLDLLAPVVAVGASAAQFARNNALEQGETLAMRALRQLAVDVADLQRAHRRYADQVR
jgi:acetoin utilization deacetylase AcuC-like enzyme